MNLKESFRYQNFLDTMMRAAASSIQNREHCLTVVKKHNKAKANPDATDIEETVEVEAFYKNDDVISFMEYLIAQRDLLTKAITKAKQSCSFDIDAAVEVNKFRQQVNSSIKNMLRYTQTKRVESGRDYKFNAEGNQMPYIYDIEVVSTEAYDKERSKNLMRSVIADADKTSAEIDSAMINSVVEYEPPFDVNESFEDVMDDFIKNGDANTVTT